MPKNVFKGCPICEGEVYRAFTFKGCPICEAEVYRAFTFKGCPICEAEVYRAFTFKGCPICEAEVYRAFTFKGCPICEGEIYRAFTYWARIGLLCLHILGTSKRHFSHDICFVTMLKRSSVIIVPQTADERKHWSRPQKIIRELTK
jgi:hypothetical protein